ERGDRCLAVDGPSCVACRLATHRPSPSPAVAAPPDRRPALSAMAGPPGELAPRWPWRWVLSYVIVELVAIRSAGKGYASSTMASLDLLQSLKML
ncbi:unnamed protein product, partial [Urochloa humidicola]